MLKEQINQMKLLYPNYNNNIKQENKKETETQVKEEEEIKEMEQKHQEFELKHQRLLTRLHFDDQHHIIFDKDDKIDEDDEEENNDDINSEIDLPIASPKVGIKISEEQQKILDLDMKIQSSHERRQSRQISHYDLSEIIRHMSNDDLNINNLNLEIDDNNYNDEMIDQNDEKN